MAEIKTSPPAPEFQTAVPLQSATEQFLEKHFRSIMMGLVVLALFMAAVGLMRHFANQTAFGGRGAFHLRQHARGL